MPKTIKPIFETVAAGDRELVKIELKKTNRVSAPKLVR